MFRVLILVAIFFIGVEDSYSSIDDTVYKTDEFVPHELIVKFKNPIQTASVFGSEVVRKKQFRSSGAELLKFSSVVDLEKTIKELNENPNVEFVEHNAIYRLLKTPNDPNYRRTYGMESMSMPEAWEKSVGSRSVLVGVIDSGIDYNHPDLAANYWNNEGEKGLDAEGNDKSTNGIDDDENGYIDDYKGWDFINKDNDPMDGNGHGTHCAGTIGAVGDNEIGVAGVNWKVSLVALKVFSDAGSTTSDALAEAIEYSTMLGVDVTNNSWGGGKKSKVIEAAIIEASNAGILFVAAAGNSSANNDNRDNYPSNYKIPNVIAVAAIGSDDDLARFSNYGKTTVHVAAAGVDVYSTRPRKRYQNLSGTSMAAPHVTGLVAFIKSVFPEESMSRIKSRVLYTGDDVRSLKDSLITGKKINAFNAIQVDEVAPSAVSDLKVTDSHIDSVDIEFSESGDDELEGKALFYEVRTSEEMITEENWSDAELALFDSLEIEDGVVSTNIPNLSVNYEGFFAVKAFDEVGNSSDVSDSVSFKTTKVNELIKNTTDNLEGVTVEGDWGLETLEDERVVFSDSPEGKYKNKSDTSLTLDEITERGEATFLRIVTSYDLETRYDFGLVEISTDGTTWNEVKKFNGESEGFIVERIDITEAIGDAKTYQIRFRIVTDRSANRDGWKIDEISVLGTEAL